LDKEINNLVSQVETIKSKIQEGNYIDRGTFKDLEVEVAELRKMIVSIDKDVAVNSEKQSAIYVQLERLDEKISELAESTKTKDTEKKDTTEKVLLLVLGAILSFVFNKFA
jgi:prefoldin subunit 5